METLLITAAQEDCKNTLPFPLDEREYGKLQYPYMCAARVIVGVSTPGHSTLFAQSHSITGTEQERSVSLSAERAERLRAFFTACFMPGTATVPPEWQREGVVQYNCIGFAGYMAGWSSTIDHYAIGPDKFGLEPIGAAPLTSGESYILQDDSCDLRPHAVVGTNDPLSCMHVFGYGGPFVYSPVEAAMREYNCTSIYTAQPLSK